MLSRSDELSYQPHLNNDSLFICVNVTNLLFLIREDHEKRIYSTTFVIDFIRRITHNYFWSMIKNEKNFYRFLSLFKKLRIKLYGSVKLRLIISL